jgi:hypothetical protein
MTPEARAAWVAKLAERKRLFWANPENHARQSAAIRAAWDDPLLRAAARVKREKAESIRMLPTKAYNAYYRKRRMVRTAERFRAFDPTWSVTMKERYFDYLLTQRRVECSQHS